MTIPKTDCLGNWPALQKKSCQNHNQNPTSRTSTHPQALVGPNATACKSRPQDRTDSMESIAEQVGKFVCPRTYIKNKHTLQRSRRCKQKSVFKDTPTRRSKQTASQFKQSLRCYTMQFPRYLHGQKNLFSRQETPNSCARNATKRYQGRFCKFPCEISVEDRAGYLLDMISEEAAVKDPFARRAVQCVYQRDLHARSL